MKKILSKILDEINKDAPRLDYIRGLIEASIEEEEKPMVFKTRDEIAVDLLKNGFKTEYIKSDEEIIPDFIKAGPIGKITS